MLIWQQNLQSIQRPQRSKNKYLIQLLFCPRLEHILFFKYGEPNHQGIEKLTQIQTTELGLLLGRKYFGNNILQNHLIFQPIFNTSTVPTSDAKIILT